MKTLRTDQAQRNYLSFSYATLGLGAFLLGLHRYRPSSLRLTNSAYLLVPAGGSVIAGLFAGAHALDIGHQERMAFQKFLEGILFNEFYGSLPDDVTKEDVSTCCESMAINREQCLAAWDELVENQINPVLKGESQSKARPLALFGHRYVMITLHGDICIDKAWDVCSVGNLTPVERFVVYRILQKLGPREGYVQKNDPHSSCHVDAHAQLQRCKGRNFHYLSHVYQARLR